jgi:hypothetical protein
MLEELQLRLPNRKIEITPTSIKINDFELIGNKIFSSGATFEDIEKYLFAIEGAKHDLAIDEYYNEHYEEMDYELTKEEAVYNHHMEN